METHESTNWLKTTEQVVLETLSRPFQKEVKIAGVDVTEKDNKKILSTMMKTTEEINSIKKRFTKAGVPPIAVLPKKVFFELIKSVPFYVFKSINEKGEVKADVENYVIRENQRMVPSFVILLLSLFAAFSYAIFHIEGDLQTALLFLWVVWIIRAVLYVPFVLWIWGTPELAFPSTFKGSSINEELENVFNILGFISALPNFLALHLNSFLEPIFIPSKAKKNWLFPNKVDEGEGKAKIQLPPAPEEVKEILIKLHEMGIKVYPIVHEDAFKVVIEEDELRYWRDLVFQDPIPVSEEGNYIIVHTFYGENPEEGKLTEKVKRIASQVTEEFLNSVN